MKRMAWAAAAVLASPAAAAEADYARVNAALAASHVLPRLERLAEATGAFAEAAEAFCAGAAPGAGARARFHDAMDAWMAVRHLRFGPVERFMRAHRFHFWPQARGKVRDALRALAAAGDDAFAPARFARANVAAQGLLAAEALLFDDRPGAASPGGAGCRALRAVAANMRGMAAGIVDDWRAGDAPFADALARPGPGNAHFRDHRDAALAFFKSLHDGLQFVADVRLRPVVDGAAGRPRLAESRASGRSLRNVVVNLEALQALYLGEGGPGLGALAAGADPKLDGLLRKAFRLTLATARSIGRPLEEAALDPELRAKAAKLTVQARALRQIVRDRLAPALGLPVGFNALDGD